MLHGDMKPNIEIKKGNVIKFNGVPTYIVDCICEYPTNTSWNKMYVGLTKDNKIVSIEESELIGDEGLTGCEIHILCDNIENIQNVLNGFASSEPIPFYEETVC